MLERISSDVASAAICTTDQRSPARRSRRALRFVLSLLLGLPLAAQSPGNPSGRPTPGGDPVRTAHANDSDSGLDTRMETKRIAQLNSARQKSMVSDAERLLQLARELNDDADSGGTRLSSAERLHKAAEIEKLAKDVKTKMVFAIGAPDPFSGPFTTWQR